MTYDINTYELILQNNSTTEIRFYTLNDLAESYKYHQFEMDTNNILEGEYTYLLFQNALGPVTYYDEDGNEILDGYTFEGSLLDLYVQIEGESFKMSDIRPDMGLLASVEKN